LAVGQATPSNKSFSESFQVFTTRVYLCLCHGDLACQIPKSVFSSLTLEYHNLIPKFKNLNMDTPKSRIETTRYFGEFRVQWELKHIDISKTRFRTATRRFSHASVSDHELQVATCHGQQLVCRVPIDFHCLRHSFSRYTDPAKI